MHFSYSDPSQLVVEPEKIFSSFVGLDFMVGAMNPAIMMMNGDNFYTDMQTYGPAFSILLIPLLKLLSMFHVCPSADLFACGLSMYRYMLLTTIVGYISYVFIISKHSKDSRDILTLYLVTFFISMPGALGIQRGNLDIIFSLLFGIFLLQITGNHQIFTSIVWSLFTGIIAGFLTNAKVFFAPFVCVLIAQNKHIIVTATIVILTYIGISYAPHLYHAPSNPLDPITHAFTSDKDIPLANPGYLGFNHTFAATASLFTSCVAKKSCDYFKEDARVISTLKTLFIIFVYILPFIQILNIKQVMQNLQSNIMQHKNQKRSSQKKKSVYNYLNTYIRTPHGILLLYILSYILINSIPNAAFLYRLYYALPIIGILWIKTEHIHDARYTLILSMVFLILKGQWINYTIRPYGFSLADPRAMNFFVILHMYYLLKTGILCVFNQEESHTCGRIMK
jgi:hypothetical protein